MAKLSELTGGQDQNVKLSSLTKESPTFENQIPRAESLLQKAIEIQGSRFAQNVRGFEEGFADTFTFGLTALARKAGDSIAGQIFPQAPGSEILSADGQTGRVAGLGLGAAGRLGGAAVGSAKALFGRELAKKALPKASKKLTESVQKVFSRSKIGAEKLGPEGFTVPKKEVLEVLEEGLAKAKVPSGEQAAVFRRWIKALKGTEKAPSQFSDNLTADVISEIEGAFGNAAKFGIRGNNPILQESAKRVNRFVSGKLDQIAKKAKVPEFIGRSKAKSKLLSQAKKPPGVVAKQLKRAGGLIAAGSLAGAGFEGIRRLLGQPDER